MLRLSAAAVLLACVFAPAVLALAMETHGNAPMHEANYMAWKGIMPVINDKARIYSVWCNGQEQFYYKGGVKELNAALANFAKVEAKHHVVTLRAGPGTVKPFTGAAMSYDWSMQVLGGIAGGMAKNDPKDVVWQRWPVLTIQVTKDIDLSKLRVPRGVTLRVVPGGDAAARKQIDKLMERMKPEPRD
jgi:hypothetical protein